MGEHIEVGPFQTTEKEWSRFYFRFFARRQMKQAILIAVLGLTVAVIGHGYSRTFGILVCPAAPVLWWIVVRHSIRTNRQYFTDWITMKINPDLIATDTQSGSSSQVRWNVFDRLFETDAGFGLVTPATGVLYIPKAAFKTPKDQEAFVVLARERLATL